MNEEDLKECKWLQERIKLEANGVRRIPAGFFFMLARTAQKIIRDHFGAMGVKELAEIDECLSELKTDANLVKRLAGQLEKRHISDIDAWDLIHTMESMLETMETLARFDSIKTFPIIEYKDEYKDE
jgi:hypothetical protein